MSTDTTKDWSAIAAKRRADRDSRIPKEWLLADKYLDKSITNVTHVHKECGILTAKELEIINSKAEEILKKYEAREWTSLEVTTAFCKSASIAHQLVNCLTEIFFETALKTAKDLDAQFKATGKLSGPLHGLPISLKDNFNIPGHPSTVGFLAWAEEPMTTASVMVTILEGHGAILFCKTNVPTAMMMAESVNRVWGYTENPWKRTLSAGGSSGGEGALIALNGSVMGVGTDIGGSIRIPAAWNWLYSLRPSFGRFPTYGARSGMPGQETINSVNGPMSTSLDTLKYYCQVILSDSKYSPWLLDPKTLPIPYRQVTVPSRLNIGIIAHDGAVRCHPPVERGISITEAALQSAGHTVKPMPIGDRHVNVGPLTAQLFTADGGRHIADIINPVKEEWYPFMYNYRDASLDETKNIRTSELWKLQAKRSAFQKEYLDFWNETGVDAIIMPVSPWAAVAKGKCRYVGYTSVWNILDYACVTFPVTFADGKVDLKDETYTPKGVLDEEVWKEYDPELYDGAPVGLQIVVRRFEEEKAIAIAEKIVEALRSSGLKLP